LRIKNKVFENRGYQINRENRCCVCGSRKLLNIHHLIPSCYIKCLDQAIKDELRKNHPYYYEWDYCCTCDKCHIKYESTYGHKLHLLIWDLYNVDLSKTSYKKPHSLFLKPSEIVMQQIINKKDFVKLRALCINFFKVNMNPKFDLI
jgi:hypothetical protein